MAKSSLAALLFSACTWLSSEETSKPQPSAPVPTSEGDDDDDSIGDDDDEDCLAIEVLYDGIDNDCDPLTPDDDFDGDGYPVATDCDDTDPNRHPIDWYADTDGDDYGNPAVSISACLGEQPPGYVLDGTDCDDTSALVYPGVQETCDGVDNNCDTIEDDGFGPECACSLLDSVSCSSSSSCTLTQGHDFLVGSIPSSCSLAHQALADVQGSTGVAPLNVDYLLRGMWMDVTLTAHTLTWNGAQWEMAGTATVAPNDAYDPAILDIDSAFTVVSCDAVFLPSTIEISGTLSLDLRPAGDLVVTFDTLAWSGEPPLLDLDACEFGLFGSLLDPLTVPFDGPIDAWLQAFRGDIEAEFAAAWPFEDAADCVPDTCATALSWASDPTSGACLAFDTQCAPFGWTGCTPPDLIGAAGVCPN